MSRPTMAVGRTPQVAKAEVAPAGTSGSSLKPHPILKPPIHPSPHPLWATMACYSFATAIVVSSTPTTLVPGLLPPRPCRSRSLSLASPLPGPSASSPPDPYGPADSSPVLVASMTCHWSGTRRPTLRLSRVRLGVHQCEAVLLHWEEVCDFVLLPLGHHLRLPDRDTAFSDRYEEFEKLNTGVLCVTIDSVCIALRGLFIIDKGGGGVIQHSTINNLAIGLSVDKTMTTLQILRADDVKHRRVHRVLKLLA